MIFYAIESTKRTTNSGFSHNRIADNNTDNIDQLDNKYDICPLVRIADEDMVAESAGSIQARQTTHQLTCRLPEVTTATRFGWSAWFRPSISCASSSWSSSSSSMRRCAYVQHLNLVLLITAYALTPAALALKCLEQTEDGVVEVDNDAYKYCVLVPPMVKNGEIVVNGSQFGIEPEMDSTSAYDAVFALSMDSYQILTTCILERYEFPNPNGAPMREHMFRCVCNYDLCNREPTFVEFLSSLTKHSDTAGYGSEVPVARRPTRSLHAARLKSDPPSYYVD